MKVKDMGFNIQADFKAGALCVPVEEHDPCVFAVFIRTSRLYLLGGNELTISNHGNERVQVFLYLPHHSKGTGPFLT